VAVNLDHSYKDTTMDMEAIGVEVVVEETVVVTIQEGAIKLLVTTKLLVEA
jgi:hypothetical protein